MNQSINNQSIDKSIDKLIDQSKIILIGGGANHFLWDTFCTL